MPEPSWIDQNAGSLIISAGVAMAAAIGALWHSLSASIKRTEQKQDECEESREKDRERFGELREEDRRSMIDLSKEVGELRGRIEGEDSVRRVSEQMLEEIRKVRALRERDRDA